MSAPSSPPMTDAETVALPASLGQQRLWYLEQAEPGTGRYNMGGVVRIPGPLDADALRRALDALVARHEPLRTTFATVDAQVAQVIHPPHPAVFAVLDVSAAAEGQPREAEASRLLAAQAQRPFDLAAGPVFRAVLVRVGAEDHRLGLFVHHVAGDEASLAILARELPVLYRAALAGDGDPLPPPPVQYADYALWQRELLEGGEMERQLAWWTEALRGCDGVLELPADRPRPAVPGWRGGSVRFDLPPALRDALSALARREGATPFAVSLALWQLLLARLAGQDDVVVGTPVGGRTEETEGVVGFFVNTLPLRARLDGDPPFRALLGRVRDAVLGAMAHADVPLDRIVDALRLERDPARPPLFQAMFVYAAGGDAPAAAEDGRWAMGPAELAAARYDLTLLLREHAGGWHGTLDYADDLFDADTAASLAARLRTLAEAVAADPELRVSRAPLLAPEERATVLGAWRGEDGPPADAAVPAHLLVSAQAARTPDVPAIATPGETLSYFEMERRANVLAHRLIARGVAAEERVGIVADRSADAVVALLAVLKAGGAYVPLDPGGPAERLAGMVADAGIRLVLAADADGEAVRRWGAEPVALHVGAREFVPAPRVAVEADALAYVIFTSGSTGAPKGVMVRHGALSGLALAFADAHRFARGERVLVVPPLSFDASVGDVFPALVSGASLYLHPAPGELTAAALRRLCRTESITMVDTAAALWGQWADELAAAGREIDPSPLRMVMMGGEAAPLERAAAFARATGGRVALVNHYGPTEATVCATLQRTVDGDAWRGASASVPIGRPVAGARVAVVDRAGEPVPPGVPGELWIGGAGVARGYLGRPGMTAERFVPDPFSPVPGARAYRTGDRVRWLRDGALEFLGRTDQQLKVRGYRIEPGEVEAALLAHPAVREALVDAVDDGAGRRRLAAWVVPAGAAPDAAELRAFLRGRLPEYMVPAAIASVDAFPLTRNGKVDRRALPAPEVAAAAHVPPRTETERAVAAVWAEVLGVERVGAADEFFALGGHSLLALPLVNRVRDALGVEVPLRALFAAPTVEGMAAAVDAIRAGDAAAVADQGPALARADLRLADGLAPEGPVADGPVRAVFLTGATGFLGAYLLDALLRTTDADVHCLVRARAAADGRARIVDNLRTYLDGVDPAWADRIVPVVGDLGAPGLGLDAARFDALADVVDLVIHNGGVVNFTFPYARMRDANVRGTAEVLRLACRRRAKPFHFVSTLGVHVTPERARVEVTEADAVPPVESVHDAYTQTKWAADELVRAVAARGLPVAVHRPARVGPDARTGAANADDYLSRLLRGMAVLGAAPALGWMMDLAPVDVVAAGIAHAARTGRHQGAFHYFNPHFIPLPEMVEAVREMGTEVESLPYDAWRARAHADAGADADHPLHALLPLFPAELASTKAPAFRSPRTDALLAEAGVAWAAPDRAAVARTLHWLARRGRLARAPQAATP